MATTITSAGVTFSDSSTLTTKAASSTYRGDAYGLRYTFDSTERTGTGASDGPAKGNFSLNSSTLANVTRLYLNIFNANVDLPLLCVPYIIIIIQIYEIF